MKIRRLHIDNYKIFRDFDLDFTYNGKSQNLIVIAGINGSGKTTLLKDFIYLTFLKKTFSYDGFIEIEYKENDLNRILMLNSSTLKSLENDYRDNVLFPKFKNVIFYEAGVPDKKTAKSAIVQFVDSLIYEKDKKSSEAYLITQNVLNSIFKNFNLQIEFESLDRKKEVLFKNNLARKIKIEDLSAGEQELIVKAFSLQLADVKDSIILIDEPESSLHPDWQSRIAQIYQDFANKNNNQLILATHSPHIVASVRKEQVRVLVKEGDAIRAIDSFTGSYGWRVDKVLLEIFGIQGLRTPLVEEKLSNFRKMVYADKYETDGFRKLQKELEKTIGYDDGDLALIRMEIARRKLKNEANS